MTSSLSLVAPPTGMTVEAKSCWKPWEATFASEAAAVLSKEASGGALVSSAGSVGQEEEDFEAKPPD